MQTSFKMLLRNRNAELSRKHKEAVAIKVLIIVLLKGCISKQVERMVLKIVCESGLQSSKNNYRRKTR